LLTFHIAVSFSVDLLMQIINNFQPGVYVMFQEYLYVSIILPGGTSHREISYKIMILNKNSNHTFNYKVAGKPRAICVYSKNEEKSLDEGLLTVI